MFMLYVKLEKSRMQRNKSRYAYVDQIMQISHSERTER